MNTQANTSPAANTRRPTDTKPLADRLRALPSVDLVAKRNDALAVIAAVDAEIKRRVADARALEALITPAQ